MNEHTKIFSCDHCDYTSKWKCNTLRHMVRNHIASKAIQTTANVCPTTANVCPTTANVCPTTTNVCPTIIDTKQCTNCQKIFKRRQNLLLHLPRCKGTNNKLQCEYCNTIFTKRCSKSKHLRICKAKQEIDSNSLSIIPETNILDINPLQNNEVKQVTQNANIINNTTNNNTIIQQIVVFDPKNMELLNDHITKKELQKMVINTDFSTVLTDYSTALLSRKENQCVRKTNLNSCSSAIHVGDNKWEFQTDKVIYPKLLTRIAYNFSDMKESFKIKVYEQLDTFIDDVASEAEDCHTDEKDEIRLKRLYKKLFNNIKHLIFNLTKKEVV